MDHVLTIVSDVVPGVTTLRGYKAHSDITAYSLPFAQAFNPVTETDRLEWRQNNSQLGFSLEILNDAGSGNADTMRGWLDSINLKIKDDTTLNGLAWDSWIVTRGIDERSIRERVLAGMLFVVRSWDEYSISAHEETMVDYSIPGSWTTTTNNALSVGQLSPDSTAVTFDSGNSVVDISGGTSTSNPDATWDISGSTVLYAHLFLADSLYDSLPATGTAYTITLGDTGGSNWDGFTGTKADVAKGWNRIAFTLASPDTTGGGTLPVAAVPEIAISFSTSSGSNITNALTFWRIYREVTP